jgi:hypothetical protein
MCSVPVKDQNRTEAGQARPAVGGLEPTVASVFRVRVSETRALEVGGDLSYLSPPHDAIHAQALLRAVLNFDPPMGRERSWRRPVAGGIRTVELLEVDGGS